MGLSVSNRDECFDLPRDVIIQVIRSFDEYVVLSRFDLVGYLMAGLLESSRLLAPQRRF